MRSYTVADVINTLISIIFGFVIVGLSLRLFLRLFGADPNAGFAKFIYESTSPLLEPFGNLFKPAIIEPGNVFEFTTLFAILIYGLIAYMLTEFIAYIGYNATQTYRRSR